MNKDYEQYIIIGGDLVVTDSNKELFSMGNTNEIFGAELTELLKKSALNIINLEGPITLANKKINKDGAPNIKQNPSIINTLVKMKPLLLSGANNHILDYGIDGVRDTICILDENNINHNGFGTNVNEICENKIFDIAGKKVGIYSCTENEFSTIYENGAGARAFDDYITYNDLRKMNDMCDYLIVLYHGGRENYRYPSPKLKIRCERFIDCGADIVICQHSHCIGAKEEYKNGTIVYGQGNTIFDLGNREEWSTSLWIKIIFGNKIMIEYIPLKKYKTTVRCSYIDNIIEDFLTRSQELEDDELIKQKWIKFIEGQRQVLYLRGTLGIKNRFILKLDRILGYKLTNLLLRNECKRNTLLNYIRCESIRESFIDVLEQYGDDNENN